jgi:UDP-2-acetamido-3-amino-2,3-dideoxy-glucuronate N-acetyltransferase
MSTITFMTNSRIHVTAQVDPNSRIGDGVTVWQYSHIREEAEIGDNVNIGRGVYIGNGVQIGDNSKIQNYALIYEPAKISRGVFVGPGVIFTNDYYPRAINSDGSQKSQKDWEPVGVVVNEGASIGARSVCVAPVVIGSWALVAAGSTVIRDVPEYALVAGSPAKRIKWVGKSGKPLIKDKDSLYRCPETGEIYEEVHPDKLVLINSK